MYLLDTNVVSELRKASRVDAGVMAWLAAQDESHLYLSTLVLGELRRGIESVRRRDPAAAVQLEAWLHRLIDLHGDRILPVTVPIAEAWGRFNVPDPLPVIDSLMAATAHVHGLTVVTRNTRDIARTGVPTLDPFFSP